MGLGTRKTIPSPCPQSLTSFGRTSVTYKKTFLTVAALVAVFALGFCTRALSDKSTPQATAAHKETVYERVMRTGVIRCGYVESAPIVVKDPNTGALSGIYYDYLNELGRVLHLKIDWSYEFNMATYIEDINAGKVDLECAGGWPDALRGKQLFYTHPIFYLPFYMYARADDHRFDNNLNAINDPSIRFATMDGDFSANVHDERFPKSQMIAVPSNGPFANLFLEILHNKADVTGMDAFSVEPYLEKNAGKVRRIPSAPLRVIPNSMSIAWGETDFLHMINTATDALIYDGTIDRILDKYSFKKDALFRITKPYEPPAL